MAEHVQHENVSWAEKAFSAEERELMRLEDQQAWRAITGILIFILGIGLIMSVSTVLLINAVSS